MGCENVFPDYLVGVAADDFRRRFDGKVHFVRAFLTQEKHQALINPVGKQGSHQLSGMAAADTLAVVPDGEGIAKGSSIEYFRF